MDELERRLETLERKNEILERKVTENDRVTVLDLLFMHPVKHAAKPGAMNKLEAGVGVGGRVFAGYWLYRGIVWGIGKISGA